MAALIGLYFSLIRLAKRAAKIKPKLNNLDQFPDIPDYYEIKYFPSNNPYDAFYAPTVDGQYIFSCYKTYHDDRVNDCSLGIHCETKEEALKTIREHMKWKSPILLERKDW